MNSPLFVLLLFNILQHQTLLGLSYRGTPDCAWRICRTVITTALPTTSYQKQLRIDISFDKCSNNNHFPEKCFQQEVTQHVERIVNFTMERATLTHIPIKDLCAFPNLRGVNLRANDIQTFKFPLRTELPRGCLQNFVYLDLRSNKFNLIDLSEFLSIETLEHLDISGNSQLTRIYLSNILQNSNLRMLSASKCNIKTLDISIIRLVSLQDIDLSYNQISNISNYLQWDISSHSIRSLEEQRNRLKNSDPSYYLRLSINLLQNHFGSEAFGRTRLWGMPMPRIQLPQDNNDKVVSQLIAYRNAFYSFVYIDNSGSTISCDCHLLHAWEYFNQVYQNEQEFRRRHAISLNYWLKLPCMQVGHVDLYLKGKSLRNLQASDLLCKHVQNCPTGCTCTEYVLPSKLIVDCKRTGLRMMPNKLPNSVHNVRYELLLSGNQITELESIDKPELIDVLDLSANLLTANSNFTKLGNLLMTQIDISKNPMKQFPESLLNLSTKSRTPNFRFQSMQLECRCSHFNPDRWIAIKSLFINYDSITCITDTGEKMSSLAEYKALHCPTLQYNSTKVIYQEKHIVNQQIVIAVGIVSGAVVLVLIVITATVIITHFHRRPFIEHSKFESRRCTGSGYHLACQPAMCMASGGQYSGETCIPPDLVPLSASPYDEPRYVITSSGNGEDEMLLASKPSVPSARRSTSQRELGNPYSTRSQQYTPIIVRSCSGSHSHMDLKHATSRTGVMTLPVQRHSTHSSSSEFSSDLSVNSYRGSSGSTLPKAHNHYSIFRNTGGHWVPQHPRTEELRVALPPPLPPRTLQNSILPGMKYSNVKGEPTPADDEATDKVSKETDV